MNVECDWRLRWKGHVNSLNCDIACCWFQLTSLCFLFWIASAVSASVRCLLQCDLSSESLGPPNALLKGSQESVTRGQCFNWPLVTKLQIQTSSESDSLHLNRQIHLFNDTLAKSKMIRMYQICSYQFCPKVTCHKSRPGSLLVIHTWPIKSVGKLTGLPLNKTKLASS